MKKHRSFVKFYKFFTSLLTAEAIVLLLMTLFTIAMARVDNGEELLGIYSYSFVVATLFRALIEAGFEITIPISVKEKKSPVVEIIRQSQEVKSLIWLITLLPAIIYGWFEVYNTLYFILLLIWNYFLVTSTTFRSVLRATDRINSISRIEIFVSIFQYVILFFILYGYFSFTLIFFVYILAEIIKNFFYRKTLIKYKISGASMKSIYTISFQKETFLRFLGQWKYIFIHFGSVLQFRSAYKIVGFMGSAADGGIFSAAFRFITALRIIPGVLYNLLVPEFTESRVEGKSSLLKYHLLFSIISGLAISSILFFFAPILIEYTYPFPEATIILQILSILFTTLLLNHTFESYLLANRQEKKIVIFIFISAATGFISAIILFSKYRLIGAAIAQIIAEAVLLILYLIYSYIVYRKKKQDAELI